MRIPLAILIAGLMIAAAVAFSPLYQITGGDRGLAFRVNSLTGNISICTDEGCKPVREAR